ncbi:MAG: TraR/DksA C4-type zinc finger protein, partial [Candidatus Latescibacteria bacterium]|nr:TraR/DksA C4-type zinc finger protein [Candidatus Latescibacterota bacterium]
LKAVPDAQLCVPCQDKVERGIVSLEVYLMGQEMQVDEPEVAPIEVQEDRLVTGSWSAGFMELATQSSQMRDLLREGKKEDARALVQTMPIEAQAALVVLDEDPEEALSITGMDEDGKPGYSTDVVAHLPTEMLTGLIAYDPERQGFNTHLIRAMAPGTFRRTVEETLDPMDNAEARSKVSFEWLRALAEMEDANKCAELLRSVDPDLLEEALIPHVKNMRMNDVAASVEIDGDTYTIPRHRFFSEEGAVGIRPSMMVEDAIVGRVLDALYEADADLMRYIIRGAWERVD